MELKNYTFKTYTHNNEVWGRIKNPYGLNPDRMHYPIMGKDNLLRAMQSFEEKHHTHTYPILNAPAGIEIKGCDLRLQWQVKGLNQKHWCNAGGYEIDSHYRYKQRFNTRKVLIYELAKVDAIKVST
jgi:hypothetical protein